MAARMTRRDFLSKSAAGAAGLALGPLAFMPSSRVRGANDRLSVGFIGPGQRGWSLMEEFHRLEKEHNAELTAVCDIWKRNLDRAASQLEKWNGRQPRKFRNLEDLLALDDLDGVIIATADFQHARMLTWAVRAGKDVYVEKPMANDLKEAKEAVRAVQETKRIVQVGTQRRSDGYHAAAAELIQSGVLGTLCKVDVSWNYYGARWRRGDVNEVREQDTDWKRFLMGKPWRPFDPHQYMEWRLFRDFSSGIPDQWMSHMIDVVNWLTGDPYPTSAVAHGGVYVWKDGRQNADTFQALLEYPTGFLCSYSTTFGNSHGSDEAIFYGTNGTLSTGNWRCTGEGGGEKRIKEAIAIKPRPGVNHMGNWLECIRTRKTPNATVEAAYGAVVAVVMAVRSLYTGRRMMYDPNRQEIRAG